MSKCTYLLLDIRLTGGAQTILIIPVKVNVSLVFEMSEGKMPEEMM